MNRKVINKWSNRIVYILGLLATLIGLAVLVALLLDVLSDGLGRLGWQFLTSYPSRKPEAAGSLSAWVGTVWIMVLTGLFVIPVGIMAAIYLEEYGKKGWLTNVIEINIA